LTDFTGSGKMKTVFVIGAGASAEVGMPIGSELKKIISRILKFDSYYTDESPGEKSVVVDAIKYYSENRKSQGTYIRDPLHCALEISKALPLADSIDNYLNSHRDDKDIEICGKIAIVYSILKSESKSKLFRKDNDLIAFSSIEDTWYVSLFKKLVHNCQLNDFIKRLEDITFITFNYDRSLEWFLFYAIKQYYRIDEDKSAEIINTVKIYHPYGRAGELPFQEGCCIEYGKLPDAQTLYGLSQFIKTFMEGIDVEAKEYQAITGSLAVADRVIYLGFAYYTQNMNLLYPSIIDNKETDGSTLRHLNHVVCYCTAYGFSENENSAIKQKIQSMDKRINAIEVFNGKCFDFFKEYSQRIEF
jgi:hypothetical protein